MRLKRIKLAGFKSFVEPTSIPFPGSMTAVVGPNGCGKSNVIDAVRWVLGESSAKNLRGDAMTDVIFNGSSSRKPLGQCSVELIFENASERLSNEYAKYSELSVKRLVTRDGQSNYFLNSGKCRRRDITDLFLGTGLGPRSYAIIEQGMISRLIESKPQELRVFIEEAAGISKYKERRRETETRIRHTTENLERLSDVRGELGQQIEKLERQAAAAERYTQLKAKERALKSELAVLRYQAMQQKVDELQQSLQQLDTEYEALKAQLQGDEAGIEKYRAEQIAKQIELDGVQEAIFSLATNITRVEEAKQFKNQRTQQLNSQIQQTSVKLGHSQSQLSESSRNLALINGAIDTLEPDIELVAEQYEAAIEQRNQAEEMLHDFNQQRRNADASYHAKKHQAQTNHSQIQSTMSMQMRTQQRIKELNEEQENLDDPILSEQLDSLAEQTVLANEQKHTAMEQVQQAKQQLQAIKLTRSEQETQLSQIVDNFRQLQATLEALQELQRDNTSEANLLPLWQSMNVEKGYEASVELVLSHLGEPLLATGDYQSTTIDGNAPIPKGQRVVFDSSLVAEKVSGTLAEKITNEVVPAFFNHIHLADTLSLALIMLEQLAAWESVVTPQGHWLSRNWSIDGASENATGGLRRKAKIESISRQLATVDIQQTAQRDIVLQAQQHEAEAQHVLETQEANLRHAQVQLTDITQRHGLVAMQLEQNDNRRHRIIDDIAQQTALLEQEQQQLERLSEQVEILEAELFELETAQQDADDNAQQLRLSAENSRQQCEVITQRKHELSLVYQQKVSEKQSLERDCERLNSQIEEYLEQLAMCKEELEIVNGSDADNTEQLQLWLHQKQAKEQQKATIQSQLANIEELLQKAQQGQQGIRNAIEQKQKVRESVLLQSEGMKARATSILEQLRETGMSIKQTMATMPEEAEEQSWALHLEKTSNAIKRLGAVNLAAVEEYKLQAERKAHLDAQDADLNEALATLQSAIRKIDKETRSRFGQTFDQVNSDLKALFPKVFGGGSAYLALTDDDLLETGVTIMARPPGKKNSTIHLLSGGEKALTALSLVFAIFRLNPAPFCLLDEVDAPLDDANVGRFCNLVSEMSQTVQFIYITHNKIAMEMASHLTGVTMAEPGVSRMVAVDVEEAVNLAQA